MHASLPFMRQILQIHQQCTGHISHISTLQHLPAHETALNVHSQDLLPRGGLSRLSWLRHAHAAPERKKPMPLCPWRMAVKPRLRQPTMPKGHTAYDELLVKLITQTWEMVYDF